MDNGLTTTLSRLKDVRALGDPGDLVDDEFGLTAINLKTIITVLDSAKPVRV